MSVIDNLPLRYLALIFALAGCDSNDKIDPSNSAPKFNSSSATVSGDKTSAGSPVNNAVGSGPYIVVDQFGYLPKAKKRAVIRNPMQGFDANNSFTPSAEFQLIDATNQQVVFSAPIVAWQSGMTDPSSGDQAWHFDFSQVNAPGTYYVKDARSRVRSPVFQIDSQVYRPILKQAFRSFYYQRAGLAKTAPFADAPWTDAASHIGPGQDTQARLFSEPQNPATERDLSGGWYDAGDYNKYTNWTADYVISLLKTYKETPEAWTDDFNLPESGNGIPDILDEIVWGLDWLIKMQNSDGSVLSILSMDHASPPSAATGPSYYGPANTSATLTTAAAFALGATIFQQTQFPALVSYGKALTPRAEKAWLWASANPSVIFKNNDEPSGSKGLGAGQQEVDEQRRKQKKLLAAVYLLELTDATQYAQFFENNYEALALIKHGYANPYDLQSIDLLLHYTGLAQAKPDIVNHIEQQFLTAMNGKNVWQAERAQKDPYFAYLKDYTWGSSGIKSAKGMLFHLHTLYDLGQINSQTIDNTAAAYLHYLHGTNPLGKVYLSNMADFGAEHYVTEFYHTWFHHASALWDSTLSSKYGPPPGFLVGGANPRYTWAACCPKQCGTPANNRACGDAPPSPPAAQPPQKAYRDFNDSWPLNSWEVTENSNGYQVQYLRLLSKYIN